jgi:hypothetical protein
MKYKDDEYDKKANIFIKRLSSLTDDILSCKSDESLMEEVKSLKKLFDSFAIINKFTSILIIDCYFEIKISLMKWESFADKTSKLAVEFKTLLEQMYEVMDDLYHYEYFGFFSTTIHPKSLPGFPLPCSVSCGCAPFWPIEPYLTEDGKVAYENVIRFKNPGDGKCICLTISDKPRLLEKREKCNLTDEQLDVLKIFVIKNKEILILHSLDYIVLDSGDLFAALNFKNSSEQQKSTYRIAYTCNIYQDSEKIPSGKIFVDMNDMSFEEAVKLHKETMDELTANLQAGDESGENNSHNTAYELTGLEIVR